MVYRHSNIFSRYFTLAPTQGLKPEIHKKMTQRQIIGVALNGIGGILLAAFFISPKAETMLLAVAVPLSLLGLFLILNRKH